MAPADLQHPVRILIVEDQRSIRAMLAEILEQEGYEVCTASNGRDAVQLLEQTAVDLILLDMRMPVKSGWQFAAEAATRTVPFRFWS